MTISIYLADDHQVLRDGLKLLVANEPRFEVIGEAADGRTAVRDIARLQPRIAILDIAMPEVNGVEATRQLAGICPSVHVIVLSMYSSHEHVAQAMRAGARGYLLKESAGAELLDAMREVALGRRYVSRALANFAGVDGNALDHGKSPIESLSPREREILQKVVEGKSSAEIGRALSLSPKTVETYRSRLTQKLGVRDVPGLVRFAIQHGLTGLE
jgi:DNA-binding NarL/FixJ family response regulator